MKKILFIGSLFLISGQLIAQSIVPTDTKNYIYTKDCLDADCIKKAETIQYFDGLGRPKQVVGVKASPSQKDVVSHIEYDPDGRVSKSYLPIPQNGTQNGAIYENPLNNAINPEIYGAEKIYSEQIIENAPLARVKKSYNVGNAWSDKPITYNYNTNTSATEVKKYGITTTWVENRTDSQLSFPGVYYPVNSLMKTSVTDEDNNTTTEYKNGKGQTVLIRKNNGTQNVDTYYIYNEYNQLAFVIPPLASTLATIDETKRNSLCYQYRYDEFGRLVEKKIPGKGWEYMVYDAADRLVLVQDSNSHTTNKWLITKYDQFGRVAYTGFLIGGSRTSMQSQAGTHIIVETRNSNGFTKNGMQIYYSNNYFFEMDAVVSVNYYDTYPPLPPNVAIPTSILGQTVLTQNTQTSNISTKNLPTASYVKNIENDNWTKNYIWYDEKTRAIGTHSVNHLGGYTKTESLLDFSGAIQKNNIYHLRKSGEVGVTIKERFVYDPQYRLVQHYHQVDNKQEQLLAQNEYNELSQLKTKKVGEYSTFTGGEFIQTIDYAYNIRGWMTDINKNQMSLADLGGKLFSYKIKYTQKEGIENPSLTQFPGKNVKAKYNGNIAEVDWRAIEALGVNPSLTPKRYGYAYDSLNRLAAAYYQNPNNPYSKENTESIGYDLNGNISTLYRTAVMEAGTNTATVIDNLSYIYNGNKATKITDLSNNFAGYEGGGWPIDYDANGNMTRMPDKGIFSIGYNYLNLPNSMDIDRNGIENLHIGTLYRADGTKLKKESTTTISGFSGSTVTKRTTDYLDGFQYLMTENLSTGGPGGGDVGLLEASSLSGRAMEEQAFTPQLLEPVDPTLNPPLGGLTVDLKTQDLQFFPTAEGFYDYAKDQYIYQYKDHLGNTRVSYGRNSAGVLEITDANDYYAFGMSHLKTGNAYFGQGSYKSYKYNGKELQETGIYAMDWRNYMPDVARFSGIDVLSESYQDFSPYHFAMNNPVLYSDPTGMYSTDHNGNYSTTNTDEIRKLQDYFGKGRSVDGVGDFISKDDTFALDAYIQEVIIKGKGNEDTWNVGNNKAFNSFLMTSKVIKALNNWNFEVNSSTLHYAIANTKVGQSVSAAENFLFRDIPMQFVGGTLLSAGWKALNISKGLLNVYSKVISSNSNRVFWSGGREALSSAMEYASTTGATTLEMTRVGRTLSTIGKGTESILGRDLSWKVMKPLWQVTSKAYATGAEGTANVFINTARYNNGSIWRTLEAPILESNGIGFRYHYVFP